jgi:TPR repeat protein
VACNICWALPSGLAAGDYNLAGCYERGSGVTRDVEKSITMYERSLSRGLFKAHLQLGYLAIHKLDYPKAVDHLQTITSAHDKAGGSLERNPRLNLIRQIRGAVPLLRAK